MNWDLLAKETPKSEIKFRPMGNRKLKYVDARFVMDRLDEAVGSQNWSFNWDVITLPKDGHPGCIRGYLSVMNPDNKPVIKSDVGEYEVSAFAGMKAGVSDCLKRCAVHFGIGRDLYADDIIENKKDVKSCVCAEEPKERTINEVVKDVKEVFSNEKSVEKSNAAPKATSNQLRYLQNLAEKFKFDVPANITKSEASNLIEQYSGKQ